MSIKSKLVGKDIHWSISQKEASKVFVEHAERFAELVDIIERISQITRELNEIQDKILEFMENSF